ncbi:MAG: acyl-CoA dehydratase activase [Planctomycetota bacterium]|jgi:predicted CoA-substrate-specific enzyme activase
MGKTPIYLGLDVGSTATKALVLDEAGAVAGRALAPSGTDFLEAGRAVADQALAGAGPEAPAFAVATGYGRKNVPFADAPVTEITCHARGALHHIPAPFTLVDIGGQDNKIIRVGPDGRVSDFSMNRKCAAGTGAFLEEMARRLDVSIEAMDGLAGSAKDEAAIGSFCTVFASTEVLQLIREGRSVEAIARGAFRSVVKRVLEMGGLSGRVVVSGGVVAHNPIVAEMLGAETGAAVEVPPDPQFVGALGAALLARERGAEGKGSRGR